MKLKDWLQQESMSQIQLLKLCHAKNLQVTQGAVNKWVNHQRIPRKKEMLCLYDITNFDVTPNDFYDLDLLKI